MNETHPKNVVLRNIEAERVKRGLSQEEVAEILNISIEEYEDLIQAKGNISHLLTLCYEWGSNTTAWRGYLLNAFYGQDKDDPNRVATD